MDLEDPQEDQSDDSEYSHDLSTEGPTNHDGEHLDDDIDSSPPLRMDNTHYTPISEYDFVDGDVLGEKVDDLLPIARYLNGDDMVNSDNILRRRPISIPEDTKDKREEDLSSLNATAPHGYKMQGLPVENIEEGNYHNLALADNLKKSTKVSYLDDIEF